MLAGCIYSILIFLVEIIVEYNVHDIFTVAVHRDVYWCSPVGASLRASLRASLLLWGKMKEMVLVVFDGEQFVW